MIFSIPPKYTREMLLAEWPTMGTYDFLHLPYSAAKKRSSGCALVDFVSEASALEFRKC